MVFFWGKATNSSAISAKLERLRAAERVLLELAFQQKDSANDASSVETKANNPLLPVIQPFDTHIPASCLSQRIPGEISTNSDQTDDDLYCIHGISIISPNKHEKLNQCDKPLVLLHGYSK